MVRLNVRRRPSMDNVCGKIIYGALMSEKVRKIRITPNSGLMLKITFTVRHKLA
jgi:hypothetical protein